MHRTKVAQARTLRPQQTSRNRLQAELSGDIGGRISQGRQNVFARTVEREPQRNARAQAFYDSEGFCVEGTLRDAVKITLDDGSKTFDSLVVLSMLHSEFVARHTAGLELPA